MINTVLAQGFWHPRTTVNSRAIRPLIEAHQRYWNRNMEALSDEDLMAARPPRSMEEAWPGRDIGRHTAVPRLRDRAREAGRRFSEHAAASTCSSSAGSRCTGARSAEMKTG